MIPKLLFKWLDKLLPPHAHHLIGDLFEEFEYRDQKKGRKNAYSRLFFQIARSLPYFFFESLIWNIMMIYSYLKVTSRNLLKHKTFSTINVLGLAISMSVCLLIVLLIVDQKSYDRFHTNSDRIYRVITEMDPIRGNPPIQYATSPSKIGSILKDEYEGISESVLLKDGLNGEAVFNGNQFAISGLYTEPSFFSMFDFELLAGNPETALKEPYSIILSEQQAIRFFGDQDPIGETIHVLENGYYTVTGIIAKQQKTHMDFEALVSYSTLSSTELINSDNWSTHAFSSYNYLLLDKDVSPQQIESLFPSIIERFFQKTDDGTSIKELSLQKLTAINMGLNLSNEIGLIFANEILYFLGGLAVLIIIIGCFNYVSLSVARSFSRGQEVGVRKVLGAHRWHVFKQFILESVLISLISLVVAVLILIWLVPQFNQLFLIAFTENQIALDISKNAMIYGIFITFGCLIGAFAGIYPALYLSSFNPTAVLKGLSKIKGASAVTLRKMITVTQFTLSITFIITSIFMYRQYAYLNKAEYGFDQDYIINLELQDVPLARVQNILSENPNIESISGSSLIPAINSTNGRRIKADGMDKYFSFGSFVVDENYIQTMGLELVAGRNFRANLSSEISKEVILNEKAVKRLQFESPKHAIGEYVQLADSASYEIIGVVQDFVSARVTAGADPVFLQYNPEAFLYAHIRVNSESVANTAEYISNEWKTMGSEFKPKIELFSDQLESDPSLLVIGDFVKIIGVVAGFSIFVSCLGLLGLAML